MIVAYNMWVKTIQHLHERLNGHRSSVKNNMNTFIYQHYNNNGHDFSKAKVQIIDILDPQVYNKFDLDQRENYWINTLCTVYPLGLNDKVQGIGNISANMNNHNQFDYYYNQPVPRCKYGHGKKRRLKEFIHHVVDIQQILVDLIHLFKNNSNQLYQKLKSLSKKMMESVIPSMLKENSTLYNIMRSFYNNRFKVGKETPNKQERELIVLPFNCKFIDRLQLNSILRDSSIESLLPATFLNRLPLMIHFKYNNSIGRKLLNYNQFLKSLNKEQIKCIMEEDCECSSSPFNYQPHSHIITGDLNIIPNLELRNIMSLGTKYREPTYLQPDSIKTSLFKYIDLFVEIKSKNHGIEAIEFENWKVKVKKIISNRIQFYTTHNPQVFEGKKSIFKNENVNSCINNIQKRFVLAVADKAANNYVIICKKFYLLTLIKELGVDINTFACTGNATYQMVNQTEKDIIEKHINEMKNIFKLSICKEDLYIPKIFWNAKLHKVPYKARFIAGSRKCTTKKLSVKVDKGLKVLKKGFSKYCDAIYRHTRINYNWSITSSMKFIERLKELEIWSMQVFDFTTLYTKLDLQEVISSISGMIDLIFSPTNKYICINYKKSFFSKKKYKGYHCLDKESFKEAVQYIISNTFVTFGGFVLRQVKCIPMGGSCSSNIADLTLNFKEFTFMKRLVKEKKLGLARLLSNNSRYVDDINIINYKRFSYLVPSIYPIDLEVERNGDDDKNVCYLDIRIVMTRNGIQTKVYNKVDDFDFPVVAFTFPSSNIPLYIGYNTFYGQVLRYSRICSQKEDFLTKTASLYTTFRDRGYNERKLTASFQKIFTKDQFILFKYGYKHIAEALLDFSGLCSN